VALEHVHPPADTATASHGCTAATSDGWEANGGWTCHRQLRRLSEAS
jgi:hypothetical protein